MQWYLITTFDDIYQQVKDLYIRYSKIFILRMMEYLEDIFNDIVFTSNIVSLKIELNRLRQNWNDQLQTFHYNY